MRIGQALGLRHADFVSHRRQVRIVPRRDNANGARAKTLEEHTIPISPGLVRLYTGYMFQEYAECDSRTPDMVRRFTQSEQAANTAALAEPNCIAAGQRLAG
jgi:hypothetical protein